ncbi:rhodanese-like domain-containing protein [Algoriphagus sp. A40]|uniref:rhodanese-like domain-containing protein n=1 Tax=Algoriphagus sp. A40 TaxID=1945863 RepID=UPI0009860FCE|nr:rhodanese-like domain-containing protein [Algoriphagus sp. A40]OOG73151.1 thiosulfate sulfurtransferase [Algoriphagus sp. A40]
MSSILPSRLVFRKARILFFGLLFLASTSFSQSIAYKTLLDGLYDKTFPTVKAEQINDLSNYQVLDTREKEEFDVSHLSGAKWVGFETFNLKNVAELDRNQPVLVYCTVGARSQEIGKKLLEAGFTRVYNLYGGIIHWSNSEKPLESEGIPTKKVHTYTRTWGVWLSKGEKVY